MGVGPSFDDLPVLKGTYARLVIYTGIRTSPLPGVVFTGGESSDRRSGLWQWLPDSWELAWQDQELAHPAVRAAGIRIVVVTEKNRYPGLSPGAVHQTKANESHE